MKLYLDTISGSITNLGPGIRIGLWVEGCSLRCPGCMTPELFYRRTASAQEVGEVFKRILEMAPLHEGITVSGGEPFEQAEALFELAHMIREKTALDLLCYSGYTLNEIMAGTESMRALLSCLDILIDGRFEQPAFNRKLWRGSDNQIMHLLSPRAQKYKDFVKAEYPDRRPMHVGFTDEGKLRLVGIPARGFFHGFHQQALKQGVKLSRKFAT